MGWRVGVSISALLMLCVGAIDVEAQTRSDVVEEGDLVQLDFNDADLTTIIDAISKMTNKNFIYDERVRGKVTIKSPTLIPKEQAYAVFESVLQVKGFTTVETPGGALKIIPTRDARESTIETRVSSRPPPNMDRYVTRLIPLRYVEADTIVGTLKPLVSKDASIEAYAPTNTVILTEAASNIRRIMAILEAIDIKTNREDLAIFQIEHADAATLAGQISEIYGAESSGSTATRRPRARSSTRAKTPAAPSSEPGALSKVRLITDDRTNSVIALGPRDKLNDVRNLIRRLDVSVSGGGRIHVYRLQHADAEDLAQTLSSLVGGRSSGAPAGGAAGGATAQALRTAVTGLAGGVSITADPATNALVIQASREGYDTVVRVIKLLDIDRPQVLVEALVMEVDVTDSESLGFNGVIRLIGGDTELSAVIAPTTINSAVKGFALGGPIGAAAAGGLPLIQRFLQNTTEPDADGNPTKSGHVIETVINAAAGDSGTNIISAPHILTMDNEQAEIRIGQNIPIISSRVQSAGGAQVVPGGNLATSVNVERMDIGVTLRVTPQITEGDSLRLELFQEITSINLGLTEAQSLGDPSQVGVPLSSTQIENVVIVRDGETVVIGGLLKDEYQDSVSKVPWLGDIPILGWAFKSSFRSLKKTNLLVFLTPHIIRSPNDMEFETIRKREEFVDASREGLQWSDRERAMERKRKAQLEKAGEEYVPRGSNPVRIAVIDHESNYPPERMVEIAEQEANARTDQEAERLALEQGPRYSVQALVGSGESEAMNTLQAVIDAGYDGTLVSSEIDGSMLFELQIGPYRTVNEAELVSGLVRGSHGLRPSVVVVPNVAAEPDPELP